MAWTRPYKERGSLTGLLLRDSLWHRQRWGGGGDRTTRAGDMEARCREGGIPRPTALETRFPGLDMTTPSSCPKPVPSGFIVPLAHIPTYYASCFFRTRSVTLESPR